MATTSLAAMAVTRWLEDRWPLDVLELLANSA